jgi:EPS-associated MarR family transcriptional regulator
MNGGSSSQCSPVSTFATPILPSEFLAVGGTVLSDEVRYNLLRLLEANPAMSQRDVARQLGISLGKVNFCVQALVEKGILKATNFKNSKRKAAYMYLLTPRGIEEKAQVTARFLQKKIQEYEELRADIARIREEVSRNARR